MSGSSVPVPSASKLKRTYNEALATKETPGIRKNICKRNINVLYEMFDICKNNTERRKVLSTIYDMKQIPCDNTEENRIQRNRFVIRNGFEGEAIKNIENASTHANLLPHNSQTNRSSSWQNETTIIRKSFNNERIGTSKLLSATKDDIICISLSSESESETPDIIKSESEACNIEGAHHQLFWKDVTETFNNQGHIFEVDDKPSNILINEDSITKEPVTVRKIESEHEQLFWKDVTDTLNNQEHSFEDDVKPSTLLINEVSITKEPITIQSFNEQNSRSFANSSSKLAVKTNNSTSFQQQTNNITCSDSDESETESDDDEPLLSSRIITVPKNQMLRIEDLKQKHKEKVKERMFWKRIEDAFDDQDKIFWKDSESAFKNRVITGFVVNKAHIDPDVFFDDCKKVIEVKINNNFKKTTALRLNAVFCCEFKIIKNQKESFELFYFDADASKLYKNDDFECWYFEQLRDPILAKFFEHQERESGWSLSAIINLKMVMNPLKVLQGNSYVKLPQEIKGRKACINVENRDNKCFMWAVLSALYPMPKANKTHKYEEHTNELNFNGIQFPMKIYQIPCFEKQNNISINVFILKLNTDEDRRSNYTILPEYVSRRPKEKHINLLLIKDKYFEDTESENEDSSKRNYHYVWIKSMSRLLSTQLNLSKKVQLICNYCLYHTCAKKKFEDHQQICQLSYASVIRLASIESSLINHLSSIKKIMKKKKAPFAIYVDYKSRLKEDKQIPYSIGLYVKCTHDSSLSSYQSHRGDDCMQWFVNVLKTFIENVETVFVCNLPKAELSKKDRKLFDRNNQCFICEKPITKDSKKVRNNCSFTGEFRGPAHEICNMNYRDHRTISVFVHNRKEHDSLMLMEHLETNYFNRTDMNTQPRTKKNFISFVKYSDCVIKFKFINSFELINEDIDTLASDMSELPVLLSEISEDQSKLLNKKMIYPDERYFSEHARFSAKSLPPISDFEDATAEDYEHASRIWNEFKLETFGEYADLHLKRSILLLADVFEDFREKCLDEFELDPSYYHNLPDYSWDVMLRKTDVTLELLTDMEIYSFFQSGTRGGLIQCKMQYSKANNVNLANYNNQEHVKYLMNFDTNYLYEWAMCQYLPHGQFKWVENFDGFDVESVSDEASIGYILEVDIDYSESTHYEHKDLPFCPEYENGQLKATLNHKKNYIIHYRYLKQALKSGLRLVKVHRILEFKQSAWLKPYIERNMKLCPESNNNFEEDLFERMNYGIFEYLSKNLLQQYKGKIVTKYEKRFGVHDMVSKREFRSIDVLNEESTYIESKSGEVKIDRPNYLLMCIEDLAKTKIYDFHYNYMKQKFVEKCSLCYIDNGSILYEIQEENVYNVIRKDCNEQFNTSDYPSNNVWNIPQVNEKAIGLFKDRHSGRVMSEFVGLRSKMYECKFDGRENVSRIYSDGKQIDAKRITFEDYFRVFDCKNNITTTSNT